MPLWHCPHCGTPQPETARCWVCRKSSTSCATCRAFRRGVAGSLGYCALDRRREPLRGDEIRGCWEEARATTGPPLGIGARASETLPAGRTPLAWRELDAPVAGAAFDARHAGVGAAAAGTNTDTPIQGIAIDGPGVAPAATQPGWVEGFWADLEA